MTRWLHDATAELRQRGDAVVVLIDPDGLVGSVVDAATYGDVVIVNDVWQLRCAYELDGRRREPHAPRLVLVLHDPTVRHRDQLPWDLSQLPTALLVAPVPASAQPIVHALSGELADVAVETARGGANVAAEVLRRGWGITLPSTPGNELAAAVRLVAGAAPRVLLEAAATAATEPLARAVLREPLDRVELNDAWADWLAHGEASRHDPALRGCGPAFLALIHQGVVDPAPASAANLPQWAAAGAVAPNPADRARALLAARPADAPTAASDWLALADWWAQLRLAAAAAAPLDGELRAEIDAVWNDLDAAFGPWLRSSYAGLLTRSAVPPLTVDNIAGFLARRLRHGTTRALLLVMDGLALTQWHQLRAALDLTVVESTGCFAMLPTVTTVSRQAIFAGTLPVHFADTVGQTKPEERRWRAYWSSQGMSDVEVGWQHFAGADHSERLDVRDAQRVVGVVVNAIDDLMHGSDVNGDPQMHAAVDVWMRHGFLQQLLADAYGAGFEIWITADHGNVEGRGRGVALSEGVRSVSRGQRVHIFRERVFAERSPLDGDLWIPPSYPQSAGVPVFARGRDCYTRTATLVSHGGLSLDEVVVPLVRVEP